MMSQALRRFGSLLEVDCVEPEEPDREVARLRPHLVICSRLSKSVRDGCRTWVVFYPNGEDRAEVGAMGGKAPHPLASPGVAGLLSVVDETGLLCEAAR